MGISNEGGRLRIPPGTVPIIERKRGLQLLGVTFHKNPGNWDTHFHNYIMSKAKSSEFVNTMDKLQKSLQSCFVVLITSVFTKVIEVRS